MAGPQAPQVTQAPPGDASKRKAGSSPEGAPAAKRGAPDQAPDAAACEERRREVAEVYAAYAALTAAPPGGPPPEQAFLRLLQAAQGEPGCRQRAWTRSAARCGAAACAIRSNSVQTVPPALAHPPPTAAPPRLCTCRLRGLPPPGGPPAASLRAALPTALRSRGRGAHPAVSPLAQRCAPAPLAGAACCSSACAACRQCGACWKQRCRSALTSIARSPRSCRPGGGGGGARRRRGRAPRGGGGRQGRPRPAGHHQAGHLLLRVGGRPAWRGCRRGAPGGPPPCRRPAAPGRSERPSCSVGRATAGRARSGTAASRHLPDPPHATSSRAGSCASWSACLPTAAKARCPTAAARPHPPAAAAAAAAAWRRTCGPASTSASARTTGARAAARAQAGAQRLLLLLLLLHSLTSAAAAEHRSSAPTCVSPALPRRHSAAPPTHAGWSWPRCCRR